MGFFGLGAGDGQQSDQQANIAACNTRYVTRRQNHKQSLTYFGMSPGRGRIHWRKQLSLEGLVVKVNHSLKENSGWILSKLTPDKSIEKLKEVVQDWKMWKRPGPQNCQEPDTIEWMTSLPSSSSSSLHKLSPLLDEVVFQDVQATDHLGKNQHLVSSGFQFRKQLIDQHQFPRGTHHGL